MLNGQTILVVEAEFLIALDLQRMLEELNAGQMLFARSPQEACQLEPHWATLALAIVEVQPDQPQAAVLLHGLHAAGIPVVISTADTAMRRGHPDFPGVPVLLKPVAEEHLAPALQLALLPPS
jgi:CheY-like chemotaxis protein